MADLFKAGGSGGNGAYVKFADNGDLETSDGTTAATLTRSLLTTLLTGAGYFSGLVLDYTGVSTGAAYVSLKTNLASAWAVKQGSTVLAAFVTTTNKFRFKLTGSLLQFADPVTATIAANHTLVFGTAGANQTALTSNVVFLNNTSGSSKNLTTPALSDLQGVPLFLVSLGGSEVVVKEPGGGTVATIAAGKAAAVFTDGTNGGAIVGA